MQTLLYSCRRGIMLCAILFQIQFLFAQSNVRTNANIETQYSVARDYYQKGQRSLGYPIFKSLYYNNGIKKKSFSASSPNILANIQYYTLEGGLSLDDSTIVNDAKDFVEQKPDPARGQMISYHLAEYFYRKQLFADAVRYYTKAGYGNLSKNEISSARFHKGYALFQLGDYTSAGPLLYAISENTSDPNYIDANYYDGFIALEEKDYTQALKCFQTVEKHPKYSSMAMYYIVEVYYFSGQIDKAIEYGRTTLSRNGKMFYANDLQLLIGHAYYNKADFAKALPFLETYASIAPNGMRREDIYQLSYCQFQAKNYAGAVKGFLAIKDSTERDSLYQNSQYFLASSYLWLGQKENARTAYFECAQSLYNPEQKENALFNYAKLSYDVGEKDTALTSLKKFLTLYPNSSLKYNANELLILLMADNRNFKEAYDLVEQVNRPSTAIEQITPFILYGRSLELIDEQKFLEAKKILIRVTNIPYNDKEKQGAYFYLGRVYNAIGTYDTSTMSIKEYLSNPVVLGDVNPTNAYYMLGYNYLKTDNYKDAVTFFKQVAPRIDTTSSDISMDAFCRQGDCYYMMRDYKRALYIYDLLIKNKYGSSDYCYTQKGKIAKFQGSQNDAIANFQLAEQNLKDAKASSMVQYELASAYMSQGAYAKAIPPLQAIVKKTNIDDSLYAKSYLNLGVCQYNLNNYNQAQDAFERIVLRFPETDEAKTANDYLKLVYRNLNSPEGFVNVNKRIGQNISQNAKDSLFYQTAYDFYENRNWANALQAFKKYLTNYPDGQNVLDARFYVGKINLTQYKDSILALPDFQYVIDHAPNKFLEEALYNSAKINYFKLKDYDNALSSFSQLKTLTSDNAIKLECIRASIRIQYRLHRWENAFSNAKDLLNYKEIKTDDKQIANLVIGVNLVNENRLDEAKEYFTKVIALDRSVYASESQYNLANLLLKQSKLDEAEKAALSVEKVGNSDYWTAKAYVLLGDIYYQKKDYFNANATLKSIIDNSSDVNIKKEAQAILEKVNAASSQQTQPNN